MPSRAPPSRLPWWCCPHPAAALLLLLSLLLLLLASPASAGCAECCLRNECAEAYRGAQGVCCGLLGTPTMRRPYCCPHPASRCVPHRASYRCELVSRTSGGGAGAGTGDPRVSGPRGRAGPGGTRSSAPALSPLHLLWILGIVALSILCCCLIVRRCAERLRARSLAAPGADGVSIVYPSAGGGPPGGGPVGFGRGDGDEEEGRGPYPGQRGPYLGSQQPVPPDMGRGGGFVGPGFLGLAAAPFAAWQPAAAPAPASALAQGRDGGSDDEGDGDGGGRRHRGFALGDRNRGSSSSSGDGGGDGGDGGGRHGFAAAAASPAARLPPPPPRAFPPDSAGFVLGKTHTPPPPSSPPPPLPFSSAPAAGHGSGSGAGHGAGTGIGLGQLPGAGAGAAKQPQYNGGSGSSTGAGRAGPGFPSSAYPGPRVAGARPPISGPPPPAAQASTPVAVAPPPPYPGLAPSGSPDEPGGALRDGTHGVTRGGAGVVSEAQREAYERLATGTGATPPADAGARAGADSSAVRGRGRRSKQ